MLVMASGGHNQKYIEQVATPCGELIKRYTVPLASAICFHVIHCYV